MSASEKSDQYAASGRADGLFQAAASAFSALTRPSRREIAQVDDLTLSLFDGVSPQARRYVAAVLSDSPHAPPGLVRRLSREPVEISAPLLIRSPLLSDIDLIALIGRHGLAHARVIGCRRGLNPTIADLVRALSRPSPIASDVGPGTSQARLESSIRIEAGNASRSAAEVRDRLRAMMLSADDSGDLPAMPPARQVPGAGLRATALGGSPALFHTALADALQITFATARGVMDSTNLEGLATALRALGCSEDRAFLLAYCAFPARFSGAADVNRFLERFRAMSRTEAAAHVSAWRKSPAGSVTA